MAESEGPVLNSGIVKLVLSGDSIVIRGVPKGGPPPEKQLNFSGITAPRLARRPRPGAEPEVEEPGAWEAREYLRKRLVGKTVYFTVDYTIPGNNREFGTVFLGREPGAENITQTLIREGLVKIREGRRDDDDAGTQALQMMDAMNQENKKGVYSDSISAREIKWTIDDARALVEQNKGKKLQAVIEYVQDGCTARAFLQIKGVYQSVMLSLTGIKTPANRKNEAGVYEPEPFSAESKYFTESRILQQDVFVTLEGTDGSRGDKLLATINHPKGNISEFLLKEGFGRIVDWSFTQVTEGRDQLRAAEKLAKEKRLRIWQNFVPAVGVPADQRTFAGTVVEIINPERMVVLKAGTNERKEVTLASVRQPRKNDKASAKAAAKAAQAASLEDSGADSGGYPTRQRRTKPLYEVPLMFESREFLRKTLVGKMCNFNVDYIKPEEEGKEGARGYPEKTCVTVTYGGKNVAEELIRKGLATAFRHRQDDESRSGNYDTLLDAERSAIESAAGVHGLVDGGEPMYVSEISSKAAGDSLKHRLEGKRNPTAVVEFVQSGSKMRVYVAKETCTCSILLAGVSCPRTGFRESPDEPFSQEAKTFVKDMVLQREVQIEAYDTDKGGNLIASITIDGTSIAEALCEEGLATVHFSADRYGNIQTALYEAEARAKAARKNIHKDYDPVAEAAAEAARQAAYAGGGGDAGGRASKGPRVKAFKPVTVVHVEDATTFYGTYVDEEAAAKLTEVMKVLAEAKHEGGHTPKKNELCAAKFAADESWYRARVLSVPNAENSNYVIKFVDYGNTEEASAASLAVMPEAVPQLKEQAVCMKFALLVPPPADYMAEATELLSNGIMNKDFSCSVEFAPPSGDYEAVQLVDEETTDDIALTMLSFGYATVNPRKERGGLAELQKKYVHEEDKAKAARAGMWIYGDVTEDPTDI